MIQVINEQQVLQEAASVLMDHMTLPKVVRFWAAWQVGQGNYLDLREELFGQETVETLFEQVQAYQEKTGQEN
ncbi:MAG: hypothetical protein JW850_21840 [Thermoflexales bacterium]|nr:hypothetical protein [Thermoflexales bacterium]